MTSLILAVRPARISRRITSLTSSVMAASEVHLAALSIFYFLPSSSAAPSVNSPGQPRRAPSTDVDTTWGWSAVAREFGITSLKMAGESWCLVCVLMLWIILDETSRCHHWRSLTHFLWFMMNMIKPKNMRLWGSRITDLWCRKVVAMVAATPVYF
jgi:hypothetical protein